MDRPVVTLAEHPPALLPKAGVTRLGMVALSTDMTIEGDGRRLLPESAALHVSRVRFLNPTTPENLAAMAPHLAEAADLLVPDQPLSVIGYGCTAASGVIGDDAVAATIETVRPGVPVVTPTLAVREGLAALGVGEIALLTPYLPQTTAPMVSYFENHGLRVVKATCLGFEDDRDMARIDPDGLFEAALAADDPAAGALFMSCTALPAVPLIAALEDRLGKPVLCSNQALYRSMLIRAGLPLPTGYGRVFGVGT